MSIEKDVGLISSGGRTATSFLGETMDRIVSDCWSTHEPDVWRGVFDRRSWRAVRWFGPYHTIVGKVLRRTGMRCVTERLLGGDWSEDEAAAAIERQRAGFYRSRPAPLVVESNWQWFGLLRLLPRVFESYRVIALVRDPRTWVRSWINFGGHHDASDMVARLGLPRISPEMVGGEWADRRDRMDVFERLCWDWRFITSRLVGAADADSRVRLVRFEDLFHSPDRRDHLDDMLDFLTDFGDRRYSHRVPDGLLDRKVNVSRPMRMGPWSEWPASRRRFLAEMCGDLMRRMEYSLDRDPGAGPA